MTRTGCALAVLAVVVLAGCSGQGGDSGATPTPTPTAEPIAVTGAVALGKRAVIHGLPAEGQCRAYGDYSDIDEGAQVAIQDATGAVVAVASLDVGEPHGVSEDCVWNFATEVPAGGGFYSAHLGDWSSELVAEGSIATTIVAIYPAG